MSLLLLMKVAKLHKKVFTIIYDSITIIFKIIPIFTAINNMYAAQQANPCFLHC